MKKKAKRKRIYLTITPNEIRIHVPIRTVVHQIKPCLKNGALLLNGFTKKEKLVLDEVLATKSNKEIASVLNVSERTVKFHVSKILDKTHASRKQLISRYGTEHSGNGAGQSQVVQ